MTDFPVSPAKQQALLDRMTRAGIKDEDLEESFTRSGGPGGQNVNKVETCVVLKHIPSGIVVRYQVTRSQGFNRFMARRLLVEELEARRLGAESARAQRIWRIRKQKAKRSKRAKDKILRDKHLHATKKELRRRPEF
jgi:protein subunit release factor B